MNDVERFILNEMKTEVFHKVTNENFSFIDKLIDFRDLNNSKEAN